MPLALTVTGAVEGVHLISIRAISEEPDANVTDNAGTLTVSVTPELSANPPVPVQPPPSQPPPSRPPATTPTPPPATSPPVPTTTADNGGGCTAARSGAPFDPILLLIAGLGLDGTAAKAARRNQPAEWAMRCRQTARRRWTQVKFERKEVT